MMSPQNPTDAIIQGSMYIAGIGGSYFTWMSGEKIFASVIALLTATLLITNIILNLKKIRQFGKTGTTKPEILTKKPK